MPLSRFKATGKRLILLVRRLEELVFQINVEIPQQRIRIECVVPGCKDETWLFHLRGGDYTRWFRDSIKDDALAAEAQSIESNQDPQGSRKELGTAITRRYAAADVG
jgi:hypothetical protein